MTETKALQKIAFSPIEVSDRELFLPFLADGKVRGCEFTFVNLFAWGEQSYASLCGHIVLFSRFGDRTVYPFPIGTGDKKAVLDAVIEDARARGIRCRITGMREEDKDILASLYPGKFRYTFDEGSFDYVYDINDLADLPGKKYHVKRTHLNRFAEAYPAAKAEALCEENLPLVKDMLDEWYRDREREDPDTDFALEKDALTKVIESYRALAAEGMLLRSGDEILAVSIASRASADTFNVHFEKARHGTQGAYAAINRELARYLREKHPDVRYLNREEDMGIEGLRQAKRSYRPHHMIEKYKADLTEAFYAD